MYQDTVGPLNFLKNAWEIVLCVSMDQISAFDPSFLVLVQHSESLFRFIFYTHTHTIEQSMLTL